MKTNICLTSILSYCKLNIKKCFGFDMSSLFLPTRPKQLREHRRQVQKSRTNKIHMTYGFFLPINQLLERTNGESDACTSDWLIQEKIRHTDKLTRKGLTHTFDLLSSIYKYGLKSKYYY